MDLEPTTDQVALQYHARQLCARRFPMETVRALEPVGGVDRGGWHELAEAGVFSLRLGEMSGGAGLGTADAVLVFEELGRALVPGPLVSSHLAAALIDGAASGERVVGAIERASTPVLIEHLGALDGLVVVDDDGLSLLDPAQLDAAEVAHSLDPLSPLHRVPALPAGERFAGRDAAARWRIEGAVLSAALLLGIAAATTDLAVAYAKVREQFDRPIGSFQAIKHLLADMLVRSELARASVYAAGVTIDTPEVGDPGRAAAGAKLVAGEAAIANGKACIQVHGGMGFTWEVDAHLYLKRAWVLASAFGSAEAHAEAMAAFL